MIYKNIPPKDIQNVIWNHCFDYENFDDSKDRIYKCWQGIHLVLLNWIEKNPESLINYLKSNKPDL